MDIAIGCSWRRNFHEHLFLYRSHLLAVRGCNKPLQPTKVNVTYLNSVFNVELMACPECGVILVPENLAVGKMLEVEKLLEDK